MIAGPRLQHEGRALVISACLGLRRAVPDTAAMHVIAVTFRIVLALILALSLSHATMARNQGGTIAGWVALCAGEDVIAVPVDAHGTPVAPHLPCPDCIVPGGALLAEAPAIPSPVAQARKVAPPVPEQPSFPLIANLPLARGPPPLV